MKTQTPKTADILKTQWIQLSFLDQGYQCFGEAPAFFIAAETPDNWENLCRERGKVYRDGSYVAAIADGDDLIVTVHSNELRNSNGKRGLTLLWSYNVGHPVTAKKAAPIVQSYLDLSRPQIVASISAIDGPKDNNSLPSFQSLKGLMNANILPEKLCLQHQRTIDRIRKQNEKLARRQARAARPKRSFFSRRMPGQQPTL